MTRKFIEVYNIKTGEVVRRVNVGNRSDRVIEKVRDGMEINMHPDCATRVVTKETET